jgi:zinc protease
MRHIIHVFILLATITVIAFQIQCHKVREEKMVLLPVKEDPTISFRLWFKVGSQNDPPGKEGLAALTASLITDGSTKKHTLEQIMDTLYPIAAGIKSQVDKEMTVIYGRTHKDNLLEYASILEEVVMEPAFREEDFNRIRTDLVNYLEKSLRYASDEELGKAVLSEFVYQNTAYGHVEEGHVSSLKSITLDDVKTFYNTYYNRNNVIIGLGGGYLPDFAIRFYSALQSLPRGTSAAVAKPQPQEINGLQFKIVEKDANATAISFGFPIDVVRGSKDFYALALANSWFGEHRNSSSHLYQVIREARGLNYGDYSYIEYFPNGGARQFPPPNVGRRQQMFEVWIRPVPNEARLFAFRAALRELRMMVDNGLSEDEFELTRKFLKNYVLNYAPTTMMRLGYNMDDKFYGIGGSYLEDFRAMIDQLTREDVNQAIRKHLNCQNIKIVFVTNEAEKLAEALTGNMVSPIQYSTPKPKNILEEDKIIAGFPLDIKREAIEIVPVEQAFQ